MQRRGSEDGSRGFVRAGRLTVMVAIVAAVPGMAVGGANISVVSPNGGEVWNIGSPATISWTSSGVTYVRIQLSRDGTTTWPWLPTGDIDAALGSYTWDPVTGPASDDCYIRVVKVNPAPPPQTRDRSSSAFTIAPGLFDLLTPADTATVSPTPTLDWGDSAGRDTYTLEVDDDSAFGSPEVNDATLIPSTYTVGGGVLSPGATYYWRVTADTAPTATSGPTSTPASNNYFSFTVPPLPGAFSLVAPGDAATDVSLTPTLDWGDSSDVATYTLLVDDDPLFAIPADYEVNDATLAVSTYTVGASVLSAGVTYYWRVTAVNVSGSTPASNNDFSFTTLPLPGGFNLLSPTDGLTDVSPTPTLDWEDSTDVATYTLLVDDDPLFAIPADYEVNDATLTSSTYAVGMGALAPDVTYYWRVTAVNASGSTGASTGDFSFTTILVIPLPGAFNLVSPADGATDVSLTPALDWEDSANAATYTLLVADNASFVTPLIDDSTLTSSTYTVGAAVLSPGVTYYWRVTAVNISGPTDCGGDFDFTTLPVPGAFNLLSPPDGLTDVSPTPTLDWGDSSDAATYTLLVDEDPAFATPEVDDATLAVSTYVVGGGVLSPGVTYYWRVTAVNGSGSTPALTGDFSFATLPVPGVFSLLSPSDGATDESLTLTLDWEDSGEVVTYRLLVDEDPAFATPEVNDTTLTSSTYTVGTGVLSLGVAYYWRVMAWNASGTSAASNNDFSFTTLAVLPPPGAFGLLSPSDGATDMSLIATLDWGDSAGADTYTLMVDDDSAFASPEIADATLVESTYTCGLGVLSPGVTYYWRVTAFNISWSTPAVNNDFSFATLPVPGVFSLLSPSDGATGVSVTPTLDWEDSGDAVTYALVVADNATFFAPVIVDNTLAASTYTVGAGDFSLGVTYYWRVTAANASGSTDCTSDFTFTISLPVSLALTAPAAGSVLDAGASFDITWTSQGVTDVRIEFSRDGGTNWEDLVASTDAAAGTYTWNVTGPGSESCLLRVSDVGGVASPDEAACTVAEITVTSPAGGELWVPYEPRSITWQAVGVAAVRIDVSRDGGTIWQQIVASTAAAAGSYTWTVSEPESALCLIRVSDAADGLPAGVSPAEFRIKLPEEAFAEPYLGDGCVPARPAPADFGIRWREGVCLALLALAAACARRDGLRR